MLSPADAVAAIARHVTPLEPESVPLTHLIGQVLREPIVASRDQPPFDRVTMDGIAFASAAGRRSFRIAGTQAAGAPGQALADGEACFEVMTGAVAPTGCDCVVPVERISIDDGVATLADDVVATPGMNVHSRGLDCRAGEPLLQPGTRLGPPEVAVIASSGLSRALVSRSPRIVVISTGDELIEPGEPVQDWQIYRSNAYGVLASLQRRGYGHVAQDHLPDDLDTLRQRLRLHLDTHDVLILSGGVSMGKFDFVPQVLTELGIGVVFHKIAQRPGKPMWFGVGTTPSTQGRTVYALPGNPVSTLVCLSRYVLPGLAAAMGASQNAAERIALAEAVNVKPPLAFFLPVQCVPETAAQRLARPRPTKGSGDFTSLIGTDGFVELPPGPTLVPPGTVVPFYRW
ncbi:MAG TPA: molybdopterin molybdotransferase MoeA [Povalibacter sp.]|uniref:molybdopterin molybdotransferase MoeA n=1 Tax=Povalibacter sp. TaxID=1962978 RepID=UPI002CD71BBC|nr:molybdopterin molybdotransferase MoeA [Povalibacter sp.]HMN45076.1 molybdopterin molybdotransferase MoeA [Povalibacter sp.]